MNYYIITFGCQTNKSDSERIASVLEKIGIKKASKINKADLIVVNMCSVRQSAVDRVYGLFPKFKKLKTINYKLKTVLTGCILKEDRKKFQDRFNLILDIKELSRWPKKLSIINNKQLTINNYLKFQPKYQSKFSALIPISNGCNNFCSYCVVPYVRGRLVCRDHREILKEVKGAVKSGLNPIRGTTSNGAREIWLLGQNVNSYGVRRETDAKFTPLDMKLSNGAGAKLTQKINFAKLLQKINDIPGDFWIRFTSPHPKPSTRAEPRTVRCGAELGVGLVPHRNEVSGAGDFSDELIYTMVKCQKVTPYLNLPVQSGDNEILKKMNRDYTVEHYKKIVKKIKAAFEKHRDGLEKNLSLSTDVIVGFPGETKKQFENTIKLFKEIKFDMAYIAKYSPRPGTAAAKLKDNVSHQEKERRYKILTEILKKTALEKNKQYIGKEIEVLVDSQKNNFLIGKTRAYKTVKFEESVNLIGKFVKVKIIDASPFGLMGKIT